MNADLKEFAKKYYPNSKSDLFAIFMERAFSLLSKSGFNAQINMQSWMFLSSYEQLRNNLLEDRTLITMAHFGARAFGQISGEIVQTTAWIFRNKHVNKYQPTFYRLIDGNEEAKQKSLLNREFEFSATAQDDFKKIPGSPIAYWVDDDLRNSFVLNEDLESIAPTRKGMVTARNEDYVRYWFEVSIIKSGLDRFSDREAALQSGLKWFSYLKGGGYRKWYGNKLDVVNWEKDGWLLQNRKHPSEDRVWATNFNLDYIFKPNVNWGAISSFGFSARLSKGGELFDAGGSACFPVKISYQAIIGFLNSDMAQVLLKTLNPTLNFQAGNVASLPISKKLDVKEVRDLVDRLIEIYRKDWDSKEFSWDFKSNFFVENKNSLSLAEIFTSYVNSQTLLVNMAKELESELNKKICRAYDQSDDIFPRELDNITLFANPVYQYNSREDNSKKQQSDYLVEFLSYSIGAMMGRYSLDKEGLIYAHSANEVFDKLVSEGTFKTFPADEDGIIPLTDQEWFKDDATNRFRGFVQVVWGEECLQENLDFVAESLCLDAIKPKKSESALETIRRYLSTQFYKDHMKTYKKRPIYWLFSSGKQKAFECLVYLHRYNEGTLSRMRTEYVTPLLGKYDAYAEQLEKQIETADSTSEANRFKKELDALIKKQVELREFDDKLKHYADMRISLDLDDGVKVNYGKFGDLLADVKAITGSAPEVN